MLDQATQLRQLVRDAATLEAHATRASLTVVLSGARAGAGVTTLVVELSRELNDLGQSIAVVDANVARPRLAAEFGVRPRNTLAELLAGTRSAAESFVRTSDGCLLLAGAPADEALALSGAACERLAAELTVVGRQASIILIDAGAGMTPWVDRLWRLAGQVLLVSEPDPAAVLDAYTMIKQSQFHRLDRRARLVVNRGDNGRVDVDALDARFAETCRRFLCIEPRPAIIVPTRTPAGPSPAVQLLAAELTREASAMRSRFAHSHHGHPEVRRRTRPADLSSDFPADLGVTLHDVALR